VKQPMSKRTKDRAFPSMRGSAATGYVDVTIMERTYVLTEGDADALRKALDQALFDIASERTDAAIRALTSHG